jgi:hypothetical protein
MSIDWNSEAYGIVVCLWQYGHKGMKDILPQRLICHNFIMCWRYRLSRRKRILGAFAEEIIHPGESTERI